MQHGHCKDPTHITYDIASYVDALTWTLGFKMLNCMLDLNFSTTCLYYIPFVASRIRKTQWKVMVKDWRWYFRGALNSSFSKFLMLPFKYERE